MIELPLNEVGPNRVLNSKCSLFIIKLKKKLNLIGVIQNLGRIIIIKTIELTQLKENEKTEDEGSNTENKLVIIMFKFENN